MPIHLFNIGDTVPIKDFDAFCEYAAVHAPGLFIAGAKLTPDKIFRVSFGTIEMSDAIIATTETGVEFPKRILMRIPVEHIALTPEQQEMWDVHQIARLKMRGENLEERIREMQDEVVQIAKTINLLNLNLKMRRTGLSPEDKLLVTDEFIDIAPRWVDRLWLKRGSNLLFCVGEWFVKGGDHHKDIVGLVTCDARVNEVPVVVPVDVVKRMRQAYLEKEARNASNQPV